MIALLLCTLFACQDPLAPTLNYLQPSKDIVEVDGKGYGMLPPIFVCQGTIGDMNWVPDGSRLVFVRVEPPVFETDFVLENPQNLRTQTVCEWTFTGRMVKDLYSVDGSHTVIQMAAPLDRSDAVLVVTQTLASPPRFSLIRVSPLADPKVLIPSTDQSLNVSASVGQSLAMVSSEEVRPNHTSTTHLALIENDGNDLVPIQNPGKDQDFWFDGEGFPCILYSERQPKPKPTKLFKQRYDLRTGELGDPTQIDLEAFSKPLAPSVVAGGSHVNGPKGSEGQVTTQWLQGTKEAKLPAAIISGNGEDAAVSSKADAVAFTAEESLFARQIVHFTPSQLAEIHKKLEQDQATKQAKMIGLALLMYSNDYDDQFPTPKDWETTVKPYTGDQVSTSGFTYIYGGGAIPEGKNPSTIILGYVVAAMGRAVVYADGHAIWEPTTN